MKGKHAAPDRRRLYRELLRLILMLVILFVALVGGAVGLSSLLGSSDDVIPVELTNPSNTTTSILEETIPSSTTTTIAPTTTTTTAPTTTTTLPPPRQPDQITVLVLNSTDTKGLAGRMTTTLADLGYLTLDAANYSPELETSVVWFAAGYEQEAQILAASVPDTIVEPFPGEDAQADITVVLGTSFEE